MSGRPDGRPLQYEIVGVVVDVLPSAQRAGVRLRGGQSDGNAVVGPDLLTGHAAAVPQSAQGSGQHIECPWIRVPSLMEICLGQVVVAHDEQPVVVQTVLRGVLGKARSARLRGCGRGAQTRICTKLAPMAS